MALDAQEMEDKTHSTIRKILVVSPNWIGDAVLATPAMSLLRRYYRNAEIWLIGPSHVTDLFQESSYVNRLLSYSYNHSSLKSLLATASILRKEGFDLSLLLPNSLRSALLVYLAGIPLRAGYIRDGRRFLLSVPVKLPRESKKVHMKEYYLDIVKQLIYYLDRDYSPIDHCENGYLFLSEQELNLAREILYRNDISADEFIVGINPGAAYGPAKRWDPNRFGELARILHHEYNSKIIIFGGKSDMETGEKISRAGGVPLLNMAGKTTIRELMALISQCKLFITNDSGPMHIAAALGVPVVAIFGSTDPKRTSPIGERHVIIKKEVACSPCFLRRCPHKMECMDSIGVEDIIEGVKRIRIES